MLGLHLSLVSEVSMGRICQCATGPGSIGRSLGSFRVACWFRDNAKLMSI